MKRVQFDLPGESRPVTPTVTPPPTPRRSRWSVPRRTRHRSAPSFHQPSARRAQPHHRHSDPTALSTHHPPADHDYWNGVQSYRKHFPRMDDMVDYELADDYSPNGYGSDSAIQRYKCRPSRHSAENRRAATGLSQYNPYASRADNPNHYVYVPPRAVSQPPAMRRGVEFSVQVGGVEYTQITERIAALTFPTNGSDTLYRNSIKEISDKLKKTHNDHYKIFNVSQKRSDLGRANAGNVLELGWPDQLAPPLDKLCSICKQIENWINAHPTNLVVIHCKGWRSRAAIIVASYMHYANVCSSEESVADRFAMQDFADKYLRVDGQPSHRRYIRYFSNLISGATKVNPQPIHLTSIHFGRFPPGDVVALKVYERMKPVYNTEKVEITANSIRLNFAEDGGGLSLRGDLLIKCFATPAERDVNAALDDRQLLFQCQFNTCALELDARQPQLTLSANELDLVDESVPHDSAITFDFVMEPSRSRSSSLKRQSSLPRSDQRAQSVGPDTARFSGNFSRVDSYENFDRPEDDRSLSQSLHAATPPPVPANVLSGPTTSVQLNANPPAADPQPHQHARPQSLSRQPEEQQLELVGLEAHLPQQQQQQHQPQGNNQAPTLSTDGADSGIGSDSPKNSKFEPLAEMPVPPAVPPKPRGYTPHAELERRVEDGAEPDGEEEEEQEGEDGDNDYDENEDPYALHDGTVGRERSVLPAALRAHTPDSENPRVARHAGQSTAAKIEPDLVARGRYDPNSKCFSYVPAKSLKEHYRAPKKPPAHARRSSIEPATIEVPEFVTPKQLEELPIHGVELKKRPETPKWDAEIQKLAGDLPTDDDFKRKAAEERRRQELINPRPAFFDDEPFLSKPQPPEPPKPQKRDPTEKDLFLEKKRGSHDDGEMDDLCDPEFYMTYSNNNTPTPDHRHQQRRSQSANPHYGAGARTFSDQDTTDRKPLRTISQRDLDQLNDLIDTTSQLPPAPPRYRSYTPKPTVQYSADTSYWPDNRDSYRQRNSRSVNAISNPRERKLSFSDEVKSDADEWLQSKLYQLKNKRLHDPVGDQRRQAERMLLEQLKNTPTPREQASKRQFVDLELPQQHELAQRAPIIHNADRQSRRDSFGYRQQQLQQGRPAPSSDYGAVDRQQKAPPTPQPILKHTQSAPPTRDELRLANRSVMERSNRSKTPSYQYDYDRASLVRQRSATPTILLPQGGGGGLINAGSRPGSVQARHTPILDRHELDERFRYNATPSGRSEYQPAPYQQQQHQRPPAESHYAARPTSDYGYRDAYERRRSAASTSHYGSIAPYQRESAYGQVGGRRGPPTPTNAFSHKPPTPPPAHRDRSRSPAAAAAANSSVVSPIFGKKPQVVIDSERKYQERLEREANRARGSTEPDYQKPKKARPAGPARPYDAELKQKFRNSDHSEDEDFGYLNNLVQENRAKSNQTPQYATKSILKRSQSGSDSNYAYNNYGSVGSGYNNYYGTNSIDSMGSSAHSGFSAPEIYASPYRYGDQTPLAEDSADYGSINRAETPAFPTSQGQGTPVPYHPLLYQGAAPHQSNGYSRSNSPKSMYYNGNQSQVSSGDFGPWKQATFPPKKWMSPV